MNNNRVVLSIVIILAVACACLVVILAVSGGVYVLAGDRLNSLFPSYTPTAAPPPPTPLPATPTANSRPAQCHTHPGETVRRPAARRGSQSDGSN